MDIFNNFVAHHVPPDFEIYVEWYLNPKELKLTGVRSLTFR